jgi:aspartokinase
MQSIGDLMKIRDFGEPDSVKMLKKYIFENYKLKTDIHETEDAIIIRAKNSALANILFLKQMKLKEVAQTDKKIIVHGH